MDEVNMHNLVLKNYDHPFRKFHSRKHILNILNYLEFSEYSSEIINGSTAPSWGEYDDILYHAAIYHDAVYDISSKTNEEDSVALFEADHKENPSLDKVVVGTLILATKNHFENYFKDYGTYTPLVRKFLLADLFADGIFDNIENAIQYEKEIFYEYQKYSIESYRLGRIKFLENFQAFLLCIKENEKANVCNWLIDYVKNKKYSIGVYPRSFNPWHIGHSHICDQAEKMFDKIIIAKGVNTEKSNAEAIEGSTNKIPYEINTYGGLLSDYINEVRGKPQGNVTIIRGIRNSFDVNYESNLRNTIQDLSSSKISFCYIFCDKEYEHISSSMIRSLIPFGGSAYRRFLC